MIVDLKDFHRKVGMRGTALVSGCFDPLHPGHLAYLRAAAKIAKMVVCAVAPDSYVEEKHALEQCQADRMEIMDVVRYVDFVVAQPSRTVHDVIREVRPTYFVKGQDWDRKGLPLDEVEACREVGAEIVYVDTVLDSSTEIINSLVERAIARIERSGRM